MKRRVLVNVVLLILLMIPLDEIPVNAISIDEVQEKTQEQSLEEETEQVISKVYQTINTELEVESDLRLLSNLTAENYDNLLKGTNLEGLGTAFEQAEKEYNINGLYLLGLACLESGYGTSSFAVNRNNLFGWNANDSNPNGASYFSTKEECILKVASKLKANYLTESGCYFNGYTPQAIDVKYCSDKEHCYKIISIVKKLVNEKGVI